MDGLSKGGRHGSLGFSARFIGFWISLLMFIGLFSIRKVGKENEGKWWEIEVDKQKTVLEKSYWFKIS